MSEKTSHKFKHNDEGFKYFIGYLKGKIITNYFTSSEWIYKILKMVVKICLF